MYLMPLHGLFEDVIIYVMGMTAVFLFFLGYYMSAIISFMLGWVFSSLEYKFWPIKTLK